MELLREIYEKDIILKENNSADCYRIRKAARTILFNDAGEIALLFVSKNNYHKLPGGGIESGENIPEALDREVMEEVGAKNNTLGEIGIIIEYRDEHELLQISYCYYSRTNGELNEPSFTKKEINDGFMLKWISIDNAISILKKDNPSNYVGKFVRQRDLTFLKMALHLLHLKSPNSSYTKVQTSCPAPLLIFEKRYLKKVYA